LTYLNQRLDDHIDRNIELTPSFIRSWRAYQSITEPKILKSTLIQEREINKAKADIEARLRKEGSGAWVQSHRVITKGMGVDQIQHKKETFWAEQDEASNMRLNRTIKQKDLL
jgi:hypothetical protein